MRLAPSISLLTSSVFSKGWLAGAYLALNIMSEINETFKSPGQRMYFTVPYTLINLKKFLNPSVERMMITTCGCARAQVMLMEGQDKWATVTTGWTNFVQAAKTKKGDICVFVFEGEEGPLPAIVHLSMQTRKLDHKL